MFSALINFLLNLAGSIVQIVLIPYNMIFTNLLPDLTQQINQVVNGISQLFIGIGWALGLLPPGILPVLVFIITIEICKHTIWANAHAITKVWLVLQKIKFW